MWSVICLHVCLHTMYVPGTHKGQKEVLESMILELQTAMCYHMHAGKQTQSSERVVSALKLLFQPPILSTIGPSSLLQHKLVQAN